MAKRKGSSFNKENGPGFKRKDVSRQVVAEAVRKVRRAAAPMPQVKIDLTTLRVTQSPGSVTPPSPAVVEARGLEAQPMTYIDRGLPIPESYGYDRLVGLVRDPVWLFCYWELNGGRILEVRDQRGQSFIDACAWVLRVYRVHEGVAIDNEIDPGLGNWYVHVGGTGQYQLELALLSPDGEWITLLVSQLIATALKGPSDVIDDQWRMSPEDEEVLLGPAIELAEAATRGVSGMLGSSRLVSSFAHVSSMMMGSSASGRAVAGSWAWSFQGASKLGGSSSSGSGGFGWLVSPTGAQEPQLDRPLNVPGGSGPNWNMQNGLPVGTGKTQRPEFKVKLPRTLSGLPLPVPSWPPKSTKPPLAARRNKEKKRSRSKV